MIYRSYFQVPKQYPDKELDRKKESLEVMSVQTENKKARLAFVLDIATRTSARVNHIWLLLWLSILAFSRKLKRAKKARATIVKLQY